MQHQSADISSKLFKEEEEDFNLNPPNYQIEDNSNTKMTNNNNTPPNYAFEIRRDSIFSSRNSVSDKLKDSGNDFNMN